MTEANPAILEIAGQLHEGVVDPDMWRQGMDGVSQILSCPVFLVGDISDGGRRVEFAFGHQADPKAVSLLEGSLADPRHNPWLGLAERHPLRRPATIDDVGGQALLERARIWEEFYVPFNIGDTAAAVLERQPEFANILVAGRRSNQPRFGPAELKALGGILPHLARAWRVRRTLAEMEEQVGTLRFILDRLERAVLVADPDGKVRFANQAADRLLSRGEAIDATRGRLRAERPRDTEQLLSLIDRAADTAVGAGATAVDAIALPSARRDRPLAVVAEPLAPAHSDQLGHRSKPGAILFISDSEASVRPPVERLRVVYGLTPAESRLAALVADGHDTTAAAERLGISLNTAKFHLKTVFEKIGVSRQAQLVRRVLADVGGLVEPETLVPRASPSPERPLTS